MSNPRRAALAVCLLCCPALTASPVEEYHEIARVDGARVGHVHTTSERHTPDGKQVRTTATLDLTLRRFGSAVRLRREAGSVEAEDGKVLAVFLRQGQVGGKQLTLAGTVADDVLLVKIDGGRLERRVRWPEGVLGLRAEDRQFARRKPRPGDRFPYRRYEPTYNAVLTVRVAVKDREAIDLEGTRKNLLRVELTPDRLEGGGHSIQPPKAVWWLDDDFVPVRRQTEMDGLGTVTFTRTTREKALAPGTGPAADIGTRSLIRLDRAIPRPYDTRQAVYRVTVAGEDDLSGLLASDSHQEVRNARERTFELHVRPQRPGHGVEPKPGAEYLASCRYIDHDDERVRDLARRAAGTGTDAWARAVRIERFVKNHIRTDHAAELVPASRIARNPRGDCRHHALLTAALCRAEGIPARTAIGLLYVYRGGPKLGFHMWAEVYIDGRWLGLDSTLGKGGISAAHVKVNDASWHGVESFTPLLPAQRILGKLRVEVVKVE
jgi:transglutaminase-like putative cysteine protease